MNENIKPGLAITKEHMQKYFKKSSLSFYSSNCELINQIRSCANS